MQETISDKKFSQDADKDGQRDAYKAIPVMVYDYYPPNAVGGQQSYPAGYYLANHPSVWNQFVSLNADFPRAVLRYGAVNNALSFSDIPANGMPCCPIYNWKP